jgi:hypothetical protein
MIRKKAVLITAFFLLNAIAVYETPTGYVQHRPKWYPLPQTRLLTNVERVDFLSQFE